MPNLYIDLNLFLDPPITDANDLRKELESCITEWNRKIHVPGVPYAMMVQQAKAIIQQLSGLDLKNLAREAYSEKRTELLRAIGSLKLGGIITEDRFKKKLLHKYKSFFREETLRRESSVVKTSGTTIPTPKMPTSLKRTTIPMTDMETIANDLSIVSDNPKDLYELLRLPEETVAEELYNKSKEANKTNQMQTIKTPEVDSKNRLYGKCITYFKTAAEKKNYDAALYRFPFDLLAKTEFELRCDLGSISPKGYFISIQDTIKTGYTQDEAKYLVYDYYIINKRCPPPEEYEENGGSVISLPQPPSTFKEFLGKLITLVLESEKYNKANPIGEALQQLREKLVKLRQTTHLSEIQIQSEIKNLFSKLREWRQDNRTYTRAFWSVIQLNKWRELDICTLQHAEQHPEKDAELAALAIFHQEVSLIIGSIQ
jgi:hypothetical protein